MSSRQLVAIMFTDIQGYTALMQKDEKRAVKVRAKHRDIFEKYTGKYSGRIMQYYGDGTLSIFKSAIDAVNCGVEMQLAFREAPAIPVRIGIHMGDILFDEVEIIGDSVNVASRIESLSAAGSVFVSQKVRDEIKNHPSIETLSMGHFEFKNVDLPMEVYSVSNQGLLVPDPQKLSGKTKDSKPRENGGNLLRLAMPAIVTLLVLGVVGAFIFRDSNFMNRQLGKSIAVLPFEDMSREKNQAYFSDGITEDITSHLSKIADLRVTSRTSTKQYRNTTKPIPQIAKELGVSVVLEGSVRKEGGQVRITAQLIDGTTDEHIWAEVYDREADKIFDIQTEVAREISQVLQATLSPKEVENMSKPLTSDITAYDYFLRGREALENGSTQKDYQKAADFYRQALDLDSNFASAYVGLAYIAATSRMYGTGEEIWRDSAVALNAKARKLNPELDEAYHQLGDFYRWSENLEKAIQAYEKTLAINPNHSAAMIGLGAILVNREETFEKGLVMIIDGLQLELDREEPQFYLAWGDVYQKILEAEKAKIYFKQAIKLKPDYYQAYRYLCYLAQGESNWSEFLTYAEKMVEIEPNTISLDQLAWAHLRMGNYEEAEKAWSELGELVSSYDDPFFATPFKHRLAYVKWKTGQTKAARQLFEESIKGNLYIIGQGIETGNEGEYYDLAGAYAFLGQEEEAQKWLELAADKGFFTVGFTLNDPLFEKVLDKPWFKKFMDEQINLQKRKAEDDQGRFEFARKKVRELEEKGILVL